MRFRLPPSGTLLALLALVIGCGPADKEPEPVPLPELNADLLVSGEWLAENLDDPDLVVLQVDSDRADYDEGHIPGARFLAVEEIVSDREGNINELPPVPHLDSVFGALGVDDASRVVIYGSPLPAARAFFTLDVLGHGDRAALLDGGFALWQEEGRPVSTDAPSIEPAAFTSEPRLEVVVDAEWIAARLDDPEVALLDARPEEQYTGEIAGEGIPRPGHIPGAGSLYWERMIDSPERPVLEDPERLRELFAEAGVEPDDTVVTYCRTGMQSSFAYFVARYLGYETRMYDGSFEDWSPREELPVEQ